MKPTDSERHGDIRHVDGAARMAALHHHSIIIE